MVLLILLSMYNTESKKNNLYLKENTLHEGAINSVFFTLNSHWTKLFKKLDLSCILISLTLNIGDSSMLHLLIKTGKLNMASLS